jgi:hypothetical protein
MRTVTTLGNRNFKNKEAVEYFLKSGFIVEQPEKGHQYRINNKVDIYPSSSKIFSITSQDWFETTIDNIIDIVERELNYPLGREGIEDYQVRMMRKKLTEFETKDEQVKRWDRAIMGERK